MNAFSAISDMGRHNTRDWPTIATLHKRIEGHFLRTGDNLELVSGGLARLREPLSTLVTVQGQTWADIAGQLAALEDLNGELEVALFNYSTVTGAMVAASEGLGSDAGAISRTIRVMKIVALNARVTASTLASQERGLEVFTSTAGSLIDTADKTIVEVQELINGLQSRIRNAFEAVIARGWSALEDVRTEVGVVARIVEEISGSYVQQADFGSALQARLDQLVSTVADTAMALQGGDRARQRLEHAEILNHRGHDLGSPFVMALAREQLTATVDDFVHDVIGTEHRMLDVLTRGRKLARPDGPQSAVPEETVTNLVETVRRVQDRTRILHEVRNELDALVSAVVEDFNRLNSALKRVDKLEDQMRIVGVNAVITCGRLGDEGMALKEVANQLAALAAEVAANLAVVKTRLGTVEQQSGSMTGSLASRPRELIDQMESSNVGLLHQLEDIFAKWVALRQEMGEVLGTLEGRLPADLKGMRNLAEQLKGAARTLGPIPEPEANPPLGTLNGELYMLYSMDSERDIHRAFCARRGLDAPMAVAPPLRQEEDDIFF